MLSWAEGLRDSFWEEGGMPVTVSSFALRVLMDHEGVMRRSDEVLSETTRKGTSAIVCVVVGSANGWGLLLLTPKGGPKRRRE